MSSVRNRMRLAVVALAAAAHLAWPASAAGGEGGALTPASEEGFRRFMGMAAAGHLGADVYGANVGVSRGPTRIELLRRDAPPKILLLTAKRSRQSHSRYFDIIAAEAAGATDVARVGAALDAAFAGNPFRPTGVELPPGFAAPGWLDSWSNDGWRGLVRAAELKMMGRSGLPYTIAVMVALTVLSITGTALLWLGEPEAARRR